MKLHGAAWLTLNAGVALVIAIGALSASSGREGEAGFPAMVAGTAARPFVYRQLVPQLARTILALVPRAARERVGVALASDPVRSRFERATAFHYEFWRASDMPAIALCWLSHWLCLLGFVYAFSALLRDQYAAPELFYRVTPLVALVLITFMNREGVYCYDYPGLWLFSAGLLLLGRARWWLFYPLFCLATLNKETSILLSLVFVAYYFRRLSTRELLSHLFAQGCLFSAIILWLHRRYANSPGVSTEFHLFDHNARLLLDPPDDASTIVLAVLVITALARDWGSKPAFLRRAALVFWPLLGLTALLGWIDELRDYYEAFIVIVSLGAMTVARELFALHVTARAPGSAHHVSNLAPEREVLSARFPFGDAARVVQPRLVTQSPCIDRETPA